MPHDPRENVVFQLEDCPHVLLEINAQSSEDTAHVKMVVLARANGL
jgi:hypothetical protein